MCCSTICRASVEFVKTGKLRALGVTTAKRNAAMPDVPAVGETVPGYEASVFYGVAGPKGMPAEVVEILNKTFNEALADPRIQKRIGRSRRRADADDAGAVRQARRPTRPRSGRKVVKAANLSIE